MQYAADLAAAIGDTSRLSVGLLEQANVTVEQHPVQAIQ